MPISIKSVNQLEMAKTPIAMEVDASSPELRSWVADYPKRPDKGIDLFEVRSFELKRDLVDKYFSQADVLNSRNQKVNTLDEVEDVLKRWGFESDGLVPPWRCDYPL
jgi:hypothetical protein